MEQREFTVRVHDEDGQLWAEVIELPGCFASGDSLEELQEAVSEAVGLWLGTGVELVNWEAVDPLHKIEDHKILVGA